MSAYWLTGLAGKKIFGLGFFFMVFYKIASAGPLLF